MASSGTTTKAQLLLEAASNGNLRRLKNLAAELDVGKGIAATVASIKNSKGESALHLAAAEGNTDICKYLINDLKLDVDIKDNKGETPLHSATLGRHLGTAVYLLKKGANPNTADDSGFTPLHYAAEIGHLKLLHLLLSKGSTVNSLSCLGTPLQRAVQYGNHEAVKILLDRKADPNLSFSNLYTSLVTAVTMKSLPCVELLLAAGVDPNDDVSSYTPLEIAAASGEVEMVKCLLKHGADPNVTNEEGYAPIEVAALVGHPEVVCILFAVTSPITSYPDWSIGGIMRKVHSEEAKVQWELVVVEKVAEAKSKGEDAFRKNDYFAATFWYTKALFKDPLNATLLSNRSLCYARQKNGNRALEDAMKCVMLKPDWPKAHYRAGVAWSILEKFDAAALEFAAALQLDPGNQDLRNAFQEARMKSTTATR